MFDPEIFKMKNRVLIFTKAANKNWRGEVRQIYLPESMIRKVWCLCHQSDLVGHRGLEGKLSNLLKGFFLLSARQKIHILNGGCDTCLIKRTEYACQDRSTCDFVNRVCRRENVHRSSLHVGDNQRKLIYADGGR